MPGMGMVPMLASSQCIECSQRLSMQTTDTQGGKNHLIKQLGSVKIKALF